jgi:hypothetical protein
MAVHTKRALAGTAALILVLEIAVAIRFEWLGLLIPGAILMWYGMVAESPAHKNDPRNAAKGSLN